MPPRPDDTETDGPDATETERPADPEIDRPAGRDQAAPRGAMAAVETAHLLESFAAIEVGDGQVIVYDSENRQAWIQSDAAVALDAMV